VKARTGIRIAVSVIAVALLALRARYPNVLPADATTIGLLIVAVLPWIYSVVDSAEFPGGWKVHFRQLQAEVDVQQKALAAQQRAINELVKYSLSASIFHHLCGIALLRTYTYHDGDSNRREMYFLRDNGLLRPRGAAFLDFDGRLDGQNLVDLAEPTEIGWNCIELRKEEIPSDMLADRANLKVDPRSLAESIRKIPIATA
jgi:hypothetical protein